MNDLDPVMQQQLVNALRQRISPQGQGQSPSPKRNAVKYMRGTVNPFTDQIVEGEAGFMPSTIGTKQL